VAGRWLVVVGVRGQTGLGHKKTYRIHSDLKEYRSLSSAELLTLLKNRFASSPFVVIMGDFL
jgi:hypothetical protein